MTLNHLYHSKGGSGILSRCTGGEVRALNKNENICNYNKSAISQAVSSAVACLVLLGLSAGAQAAILSGALTVKGDFIAPTGNRGGISEIAALLSSPAMLNLQPRRSKTLRRLTTINPLNPLKSLRLGEENCVTEGFF